MNNPLLSIITVCYNSEKTIKKTINSLLCQSFTNFEYIIIDGKSSDKTMKIVKSFEENFKEKNIQFKWISEKDSGIYQAFNKGLKKVNGQWVSFLGSDDYYLKNALKDYANEILNSNNNLDFIYSNVDILDENENKIKSINDNWSWAKFKRFMNIAHVGSFHNQNYFIKYGNFNESYKIAGDYELLLRAKEELKTKKVDVITTIMGSSGVSNHQISIAFKETFKAKNKIGKVNYWICLFDYFLAITKYQTKIIISAIIR